jgi:hypothetical protein
MSNATFFTVNDIAGNTYEYAWIDRGNGEFTSMLKADYEAQQAASTLPSNSSTPQAGA